MIIREFQQDDQKAVEEIFALYWTDPEFIKELTEELGLYLKNIAGKESSFFVAEENNEILGIGGLKKMPSYLNPYTLTEKPVEFYVIAVRYKRKGIGQELTLRLMEEARKLGFTEMLLYSPNTHSESWNFYEKSGFDKVGEITPPEDEIGQVWRKIL